MLNALAARPARPVLSSEKENSASDRRRAPPPIAAARACEREGVAGLKLHLSPTQRRPREASTRSMTPAPRAAVAAVAVAVGVVVAREARVGVEEQVRAGALEVGRPGEDGLAERALEVAPDSAGMSAQLPPIATVVSSPSERRKSASSDAPEGGEARLSVVRGRARESTAEGRRGRAEVAVAEADVRVHHGAQARLEPRSSARNASSIARSTRYL